jgi:DNA-binding transcriptional MerR regulator
MPDNIQKVYFSIGEVADKLGINTSTIRHWESEFSMLKPKKNKKGERQFAQKDIDLIQTIYQLIKEKGYTIQGAREFLKSKPQEKSEKAALIESLEQLKAFLLTLKERLDEA